MGLFSIKDLNVKKSEETVKSDDKEHDILIEKHFKEHLQAIENVKELAGRFPEAGEMFFLWSLKSFNAFTFIQYIIQEHKMIDELIISSYNVGKVIILSLMHLVDIGAVKSLKMIVSDVSKTRFPQNYELINMEAGKRSGQVQVYYKWNHSKIALAYCKGNYFVLEGSGNFADNSRHEQYLFTNSKSIYEFRKNWMIDGIIR